MVKKLFKHEFLSYARVMGIVYGVLLTLAAANRIIQIFESDSIAYNIVFTISAITYGVSIFLALAFSGILCIIRFYKNLFTAEGYLTFTLPVTPTQHIFVKVVTAVCVEMVTLIVVMLSGCVICAGDMLAEIWKAGAYIYRLVFEEIGIHTILVSCEMLLIFLLALFASFLMYYTFISIGQLFKKNRILAAIGAYFVYYILMQILSTILMVCVSLASVAGAFDNLAIWFAEMAEKNPLGILHLGMGAMAVIMIIGIVIEFFVTKVIITRKLNLE